MSEQSGMSDKEYVQDFHARVERALAEHPLDNFVEVDGAIVLNTQLGEAWVNGNLPSEVYFPIVTERARREAQQEVDDRVATRRRKLGGSLFRRSANT
jgi:hypothetical protein